MPLNLDRYNERVKAWLNEAVQRAKSNATAMGITHVSYSPSGSASVPKIKGRQKIKDGAIYMVGFSFARALIYPHYGAGKGVGGSKGSRWTDPYGNSKKTDPKSLNKIGTGSTTRVAKPWFNKTMEDPEGVEDLATIAAEELGDAIVNNMLIGKNGK